MLNEELEPTPQLTESWSLAEDQLSGRSNFGKG